MQNKHLTTLNLEPFIKNSIGLNQFMNSLYGQVEHANTGNYPPYNIIEDDENHYRVEVAVAGFAKEDIKVTVENFKLILEGSKVVDASANMLHNGISSRDFVRSFALADHVEVTDATVENGILTVQLERNIPEALKPKQIKIK